MSGISIGWSEAGCGDDKATRYSADNDRTSGCDSQEGRLLNICVRSTWSVAAFADVIRQYPPGRIDNTIELKPDEGDGSAGAAFDQ